MSSLRPRPRDGCAGPAGFTLIELMMALVLTGLLSTLIFQFIQGESRTVELQNARGAVLQNARGTIELLTSELRMISGGGIEAGGENTITFRLPTAWGVYCQPGEILFVGAAESGAAVVHDRAADTWNDANITGPLGGADDTDDKDLCKNLGGGLLRPGARTATLDAPWSSLQPGDEFYLYDVVTYELRDSGDGTHWVYRIDNGNPPQPVAGPVTSAGEGLKFTYRDAAGTEVLNPADPAGSAAKIEVVVRMRSRNEDLLGEARPWKDEATAVIHLRNRL